MLITGAGGFAKQLLEIMDQLNIMDHVVLFDDVSLLSQDTLYEKIPIVHTDENVKEVFKTDNRFVLGVGNPHDRSVMADKFIQLGGVLTGLISPVAHVSKLFCRIGEGVSILTGVIIENGVWIGNGVLVNVGTIITHDTIIGAYSEIGPGVKISGSCKIGSYCSIGTGSIIIPNVNIGNNVVIAAGSVVISDIPDNVLAAGIPAQIKRSLTP